jgi:hypothetical protein
MTANKLRPLIASALILFLGPTAFAQSFLSRMELSLIPQNPRSNAEFMSQLKAMPKTPVQQDAIFNRYALVYQSQAMNAQATPEFPRVIFSIDYGKLFIGYQPDFKCLDNPKQSCVEFMEFNEKRGRYEFGVIGLANGGATQAKINRFAPGSNSEALCLTCHIGGRPNWDTYRMWPGTFGSADGELYLRSSERKSLIEQVQKWAKNPDYSPLQLAPEALDPSRPKDLRFIATQFGGGGGGRNTFITEAASRYNFKRIAAMLKSQPQWNRVKSAAMAALIGCSDLESYFPPQARQRFKRSLNEIYRTVSEANTAYHQERIASVGDAIDPKSFSYRKVLEDSEAISRFLWTLQDLNLEGENHPSQWSTASFLTQIRGNSLPAYAFETGTRGLEGLFEHLRGEFGEIIQVTAPPRDGYPAVGTPQELAESCSSLQFSSLLSYQ